MKKRFDNITLGAVSGLLVPALVLLTVFLYTFKTYSLADFFTYLKTMKALSKMLSLCVIPNLLLFFIYIWTDNDLSARGVLIATFFWAVVTLLVKFVL